MMKPDPKQSDISTSICVNYVVVHLLLKFILFDHIAIRSVLIFWNWNVVLNVGQNKEF